MRLHPRAHALASRRVRAGLAELEPLRLPVVPARRAVRSLLVTFVVMAVLYGLYYFPHATGSLPERAIGAYLVVQARCLGALVSVFDPLVRVSGTRITGAFALDIVKDCSSIDVQALLVAAIIGFPSSWRAKLAGCALGIALLNAANLLRMLGLYVAGMQAPDWFDTLHEEIMPFALMLVACGCFTLWAARVLASTQVGDEPAR